MSEEMYKELTVKDVFEKIEELLPPCSESWGEFTLDRCWDGCWQIKCDEAFYGCFDTALEALLDFIEKRKDQHV